MPLFSRKKEKAKKAPKPVEEKATENPAGGEDEDSDDAPTQVYRHAYTRTLEVEDGCDTGGVGEEGLGWAWLGLAQRPRRLDVPPRRRRCGVRLCIAVCLCPRARARVILLYPTLCRYALSVLSLPASVVRFSVAMCCSGSAATPQSAAGSSGSATRCWRAPPCRGSTTELESATMSRFYN